MNSAGGEVKSSILLLNNVADMKGLKEDVIRSQLRVALIKTKLILHLDQVLHAIHKGLHSEKCKTMKTKSIVSEIVYSLSPSKNIKESLNNFAVGDNDTSAIFVLLDNEKHLQNFTLGDLYPFDRLSEFHSIDQIRKIYKVPKNCLTDDECLLHALNTIATKEFS